MQALGHHRAAGPLHPPQLRQGLFDRESLGAGHPLWLCPKDQPSTLTWLTEDTNLINIIGLIRTEKWYNVCNETQVQTRELRGE
jgi:hypothetical protein